MTPRNRPPFDRRESLPPLRDERHEDALIAIFILGVALFSPLVIGLFDRGGGATVAGVPLLYLYLFAAWGLLVGLIGVTVGRAAKGPGADADLPGEESRGG